MANSEKNKAGFNLCSQPLKTPRRSKSPLPQPRSKDVDTGCRSPLQKSTKTTEDYNETVDKNYSTGPLNESTTTASFQEPHGSYQSNFNKQYRPGVGYSMARIGMPIPAPPYRARSGVSQIPQTREVFTSSQFGFPQPGRYIVRNPTPFHYGLPRYSSGRGFTPVGVIVDPSLSPRLPRRRPENFGERMHAETQTSFGSVPTPLTSSSSEHPHDSSHFSFDHTSPKHKHKTSLSITTQPVSTQVKHSSPATPPQLTPTSPITPIVSGRKLSRKSSMFDLSDVFCLSCSPARLGFSSSIAAKYPYATDPQKDQDFIGFASLPEQVHRKTVKRGFDFTLMVVGESGLGKSTLVSSLFLTDLYKDKTVTPVHQKIEKTVSIEKKTIEIEEKGVKLRLTVVDTPGFGDALNCEENWKAVERYVDEQFNQYFQDESGLNRKNIQDHRVHCCLYFIPPYGHGLRQLDIEFLRRLQNKVNIVPVVAKADTLTPNEIRKLKARILSDIEEYKVKIYQFPECDEDEDEDFKQQDRALKASIPFAVIGSNCVIEVAGKKVRGRQYPWGIVEVENATHCDFVKLRTMLISTHMQDLKEVTQDVHYETFRARCISQMHVALKERNKLKRDSVTNLDQIGDADRLLQQKDEEIRKMQEMLNKMQQKLKESSKENTTSYPVTIENSQRDSVINV